MDKAHSPANQKTGSPTSTPFMERMKQSLGGKGGSQAASGKASSPNSPGSPGSPSSDKSRIASSAVLRRRDREARNALSMAAKAFTDVVDTVEQAAKKVSLGSIASAVANITREKKSTAQTTLPSAPIGVTHAYSVVLQHTLAPLWSVDRKPMEVSQHHVSLVTVDAVRLLREMELSKANVEAHLPLLNTQEELAAVFIIAVCAKLRWLEAQDPWDDVASPMYADPNGSSLERGKSSRNMQQAKSAPTASKSSAAPSFEHLVTTLRSEFQEREKDDQESRFENRQCDENQTADQPKRRLVEVGGKMWKPKGALMLSSQRHEERHRLLVSLMTASVILTYNYYDPLLQFVVDDIACRQLFLTSFSEGFATLVAGVKGPNYVCKYFLFSCRDSLKEAQFSLASGAASAPSGGEALAASERTSHFSIPTVVVDSVILQEISGLCDLAIKNLAHRNDTSVTIFKALRLAILQLTNDERISCSALFFTISWALRVCYIADVEVLIQMVDILLPMTSRPNPVGSQASRALKELAASIRNINCLQRGHLSRLFVGGPERSFRRIPAYVLVSPYCARANITSQIYWNDIDMQRGDNRRCPVALPAGTDPFSRQSMPQLDDATQCLGNHLTNCLQATYELLTSKGDESPIDLLHLFKINPTTLTALYPSLLQILSKTNGIPVQLPAEAQHMIHELYMTIQDRYRPSPGAIKFRNENPFLPIVPLKVHKYFERDDLEGILKSICDDFATSCDARINEKDVAFLHPSNHLSLRVFIESSTRLVLCGGGGLIRRAVTTALRLQHNYPGAFIRPIFFVLPFGYSNDIANWLARGDCVYREKVYAPFCAMPLKSLDPPTPETWATLPSIPELPHLLRRSAINHFLMFAQHINEITIYQAECTFVDSTMGTCFIPFASNLEIGSHVNTAALMAQKSGQVFATNGGVIAPPTALHSTTFATERSRGGVRSAASSLQRTGTAGSLSGSEPSSSSNLIGSYSMSSMFQPASSQMGPTALGNSFVANFTIPVGDRTESLDRILVRMHGSRGIPLSTKQNSVDGSDAPNCAEGVDILDWISTSYHIYDLSIAHRIAQSFLDSKLLSTVCVPVGKDPFKFLDSGLYTLLAREELDAQPLCPPSSRSSICEHSNLHRIEFEEAAANTGGAAASQGAPQNPSLKVRVTFQSFFERALQYNDLVDSKETTHRDIIYAKLKSTGSADDIGPVPNPMTPTLVMTVLQQERKKQYGSSAAKQRDVGDILDHYQLKFGEKNFCDARSTLQFDWKAADGQPSASFGGASQAAFSTNSTFGGTASSFTSQTSGASATLGGKSQDAVGMYCMCDGDVFGPFSSIRVKPIAVKMLEGNRATFATASIASFTPAAE